MTITRPAATVMVVSWTPLSYSEARGFISHYTVAYSPLTSERKRQALDTMTQTVPGMDTDTTRIEGLDANTDYIVQVSATNGAEKGEASPPVLATVAVKGKKEAPANAIGSTMRTQHSSDLLTSFIVFIVMSQGCGGAVIGIVAALVIALLVVAALIVVIVILWQKFQKYKQ